MGKTESIRNVRKFHPLNSKSMVVALLSASFLLGTIHESSMAFAFSSPGSFRSASRTSTHNIDTPSTLCPMNLEMRTTPTLQKMTNEDKEAIERAPSSILPTERTSSPATKTPSKTQSTRSISSTKNGGEKSGILTAFILLPSLLFKFTIVLLVKFATDVVVYPFLFAYGLARVGKKKLLRGIRRVFGSEASDNSNNASAKGTKDGLNGDISASGINGRGVLNNIKVNGDS